MRANRAAVKGGARRGSDAKERFWRGHVGEQAAGGLSVRLYCERHGLTEPSFYAWRRELTRRAATTRNGSSPRNALSAAAATGRKPAVAVKFARLDVLAEPPLPHERIEIVLGDGAVVRVPRGADEATLATVLTALAAAKAQPC